MALSSPGLTQAPFYAALDRLRDSGYTIDIEIVSASELAVQGVASGEFTFSTTATNALLTAVVSGANIKVVGVDSKNSWTLYARNDITECADLDGRRVAIHSPGSVSTAMIQNYIDETCPGTEPEYIIIAGSPNRLAALLADQIDATPLELNDAVTVDIEAADRYSMLANFGADLPNLLATTLFANGDFVEQYPGTMVELMKALVTEYRRVAGDADALKEDAEQYVADYVDADTLDEAVALFTELEMFPVNGGLTEENLTYTMNFFGPDGMGAVEQNLPLEEWSDRSFLEAALEELGTE